MHLQLLIDVLHVERDRAEADAELGGGARVVVALDEHLQQPHFVRRQVVVGVLRRRNRWNRPTTRRATSGDIGAPPLIASLRLSSEARRRRLLQQVAAGAGAERVEDPVVIVIDRQDQEPAARDSAP